MISTQSFFYTAYDIIYMNMLTLTTHTQLFKSNMQISLFIWGLSKSEQILTNQNVNTFYIHTKYLTFLICGNIKYIKYRNTNPKIINKNNLKMQK